MTGNLGATQSRRRCISGACFALLLVGACSDEGLDAQTCEMPPEPGSFPQPLPDIVRSGRIVVQDTWDRTEDDSGVPRDARTGRVQAGFVDLSTVTSTPAQFMALSEVCIGLTSRPVRDGRATPLTVSEVRVEGTARGPVVAPRAGAGTYISVGTPLLGEGQGDLRAVVSSTSATAFPGGALTVAGLRSDVGLTAPDPLAPAPLEADVYPIRWVSAGAEWAQITLTPVGDGVDDGGQVVCTVADTGCFDLPVAATAFLLSANAASYTFSIDLHRATVVSVGEGASLELEAATEVRLTLPNGVAP